MIRKIKNNIKIIIFCLPAFAVAICFTILPLIKTLQDSFAVHGDKYNYDNTSLGFKNYHNVFEDPLFQIGFVNTSFLIFIIAPIFIIIFFMIAFCLHNLSSKIIKNSFISLIFIQFFISSYAIGIVFLVLFSDDHNVLNSIFKTSTSFGSKNNKFSSLLALSIFFVWRVSVISLVLFTFAIHNVHKKYVQLGRLDNLNFFKKILVIYVPQIKNTIYIIIYLNILTSLFLYPIFYENAYIVNGQTIMYYIIDKFNDSNQIQWSLASVASIYLFLYSLVIIGLIFIIKNCYSYFHKKWTRRRTNVI